METSSPQLPSLQPSLDRLRAGDRAARDALLRAAWDELGRLTRRMFRRFPRLRAELEADDVQQQAALRLWRALGRAHPTTAWAFLGLARRQARRVLLDEARRLDRRPAHALGHPMDRASERGRKHQLLVPPDRAEAVGLECWGSLHDVVVALPVTGRILVDLLMHDDRTQDQAARILGVSVRTVRRRWEATLGWLRQRPGGEGCPSDR